MKSSVLLIPSHHSFYSGNFLALKDEKDSPVNGIELTEEMLSWPRYGRRGKLFGGSWDDAYKNALEALLNIPPFGAQVSIWADVEKKHLCLTTEHEWGIIYLEGRVVVSFSHDTRYDNKPFYGLLEWTEQVDDDESMEKIKKWPVDQWKIFFYSRIRSSVEDDLSTAKKKIKKAKKQKECAEKILAVIPV